MVVETLKLVLSATWIVPVPEALKGARGIEWKNEGMRRDRSVLLDGGAVGRQIAGRRALEDPEIVQGNLRKGLCGDAKILGEHFRRCVRKPVGDQ
jgi:hypothetical protein